MVSNKMISNKIRNFSKRFDIQYDEGRQFYEFKNRVIQSFDNYLGDILLNHPEFETKLIKFTGLSSSVSLSKKIKELPSLISTVDWMQVREETTTFNETRIFDILSKLTILNFTELIKCIQCVFWLPLNDEVKNAFYESIKEDIEISRVSVSTKKN
jgi:hypothetical protein